MYSNRQNCQNAREHARQYKNDIYIYVYTKIVLFIFEYFLYKSEKWLET